MWKPTCTLCAACLSVSEMLTVSNCDPWQGGTCYSLVSTINHFGSTEGGKKTTDWHVTDRHVSVYRVTKYTQTSSSFLVSPNKCWSVCLKMLTMICLLVGHYICDGIHPEDRPDEPTNRWLTYNDAAVSETTGSDVCEARKEKAYVLFYKRNVRGQTPHPKLTSM